MRIKLNETPSKCAHIILEIAGRRIVTTKQDLMGTEPIDVKDLKVNILLNDLRNSIRSSGEKDWAKIKQVVEVEDFKI